MDRDGVRLARRSDGPQLAALFADVPMAGNLVVATRRDPDFFRLYDIQRGASETSVLEVAGRLVGLGTVLVREGWYQGRPCSVGYLGDLRIAREGRAFRALPRFYGSVLQGCRERHDCKVFLTGIIASNTAALNALVRRRASRANQPRYTLFRRFTMVSLQFARRRAGPRDGVRRARPGDVSALVQFLADDHRRRPFGYRFDAGELEHRLAAWPGFSLDNTYVAFAGERIVGCTTAWDPSAVKRYQVLAYRGPMLWTKRAYNAVARLARWPALPDPGDCFRTLYLCNTSVADDDPVVLRALLQRIYADFHGRGYHFISLPIYEEDSLAPAVKGFLARRLDFHLYTVNAAKDPEPEAVAGRPGFEMALA
jgi:hypothetical protein